MSCVFPVSCDIILILEIVCFTPLKEDVGISQFYLVEILGMSLLFSKKTIIEKQLLTFYKYSLSVAITKAATGVQITQGL